MSVTPTLLIILDGFGCRRESAHNAIRAAHKPYWDNLWQNCPHTVIDASATAVGLPSGQMGNSEVGHLNIGAGRVVYQEFSRIQLAIESGHFYSNPALKAAIETAKGNGRVLHILGLLSDGGVHSHEAHIHAMLEMAAREGVEQTYLHLFLDGRDTAPKSAIVHLQRLEEKRAQLNGYGRVASIVGRYFAMDRDRRWQRVKTAYDVITMGRAAYQAPDAFSALAAAYERGESDEFVAATVIAKAGEPLPRMQDGDVVVMMNFRSDRVRQLAKTFLDPDFDDFERESLPRLSAFCTLTSYSEDLDVPVAFPPERVHSGFGEYIAKLGLTQLRIAETEKYPHVTFFFNAGGEEPYPGEDRILIPSPDVATYDLKPEMSAFQLTDALVEAIHSRKYHAIICNYANADMVGHTGNFDAARCAIEALDVCLDRVVSAMRETGGEVLITADHGNAELMLDVTTSQAHTAHTLNRVPLVYVGGRPAAVSEKGALEDIAPTLLKIMGLPQPPEMTGRSLIEFGC